MVDIIKDGKVVGRSQNLRGQLEYARKSPPVRVELEARADGCAFVLTIYADGARSGTEWASFDVADHFYRRRAHNRASNYSGLVRTAAPGRVVYSAEGGAS